MKIFSTLKKHAISFLEQYKQQSPATLAAAEQAIGAVLIADGLIGIDNPFGGKKRPGIFGAFGGIFFGILFLFIPSFFGNVSGIKNMTATTTATVQSVGMSSNSSSSSTCPLTVHYTVNGKEYTNQSSMSSSSYCSLTAGQTITVNYNPDNPGAWAYDVKSVSGILMIFFFAGLLVILSSIVTFVIRLLSIIFGWNLVRDGRKLAATLPPDTNFQTIVNEIKQNFIKNVFNFGGMTQAPSMMPTNSFTSPQPPVQPLQNPPYTPPTDSAPPMGYPEPVQPVAQEPQPAPQDQPDEPNSQQNL